MSGRTPGLVYRPDIDGMRAVAVLVVLAFHAFPEFLSGGFVGVDVFFVISGYLISGLILSDLARGQFTFKGFYSRRVRRIFPALALLLTACLGFGLVVLLPEELLQLGKHVTAGAAFFSNFALLGELGYFDNAAETKPLLHLWSLGIEEQFYLVWPVVLVAAFHLGRRLRRNTLPWVIAGVMVASFAFNLFELRSANLDNRASAFYLPLARFWELMLGALAASSFSKLRALRKYSDFLGLFGIAFIAYAAWQLNRRSEFPGWIAGIPTLGAVLLLLAGPGGLVNRKLLAHPALVAVGRISYPLYLWHWPLLSFARILEAETPSVPTRAVALAASAGLAWATYRWVERPLRFEMEPRRAVTRLSVSLAVIAAAGGAVYALKGLPIRLPESIRGVGQYTYTVDVTSRESYCSYRHTDPAAAIHPDCLGRARNGSRPRSRARVCLRASFLARGLREVSGSDFWVAQHARDNCPPVLRDGVAQECIEANRYLFQKLRETTPDTLVLYAAWNMYSFAWQSGGQMATDLMAGLKELHSMGIRRILLLGPPPQWKDSLAKQLVNFWRADPLRRVPERMNFGLKRSAQDVDRLMSRLAVAPTQYVSVQAMLCTSEGCLTRFGSNVTDLMTADYGHFTPGAAAHVARQLTAQLNSH